MQIAVLVEQMRREGYEVLVSRPEVILKKESERPHARTVRNVVDRESRTNASATYSRISRVAKRKSPI